MRWDDDPEEDEDYLKALATLEGAGVGVVDGQFVEVKRGRGRPKGSTGGKLNTQAKASKAKKQFLQGKTLGEISASTGLSTPTIIKTVRELSIDSPERIGRFTKAKRIAAIDDMVDLMYEVMHPVDDNGDPIRLKSLDLRNLAISLGVLIDKRRLEENLSTSNADQHVTVEKKIAWSRREVPLLSAGK